MGFRFSHSPDVDRMDTLRFTWRRVFEEGQRELFVGDADVEQDQPWWRIVDYDVLDGQPEEQLLLGEAFQALEPPVGEVGSHDAVEVDLGLELGQAGLV